MLTDSLVNKNLPDATEVAPRLQNRETMLPVHHRQWIDRL
jgi:hypothetical protein